MNKFNFEEVEMIINDVLNTLISNKYLSKRIMSTSINFSIFSAISNFYELEMESEVDVFVLFMTSNMEKIQEIIDEFFESKGYNYKFLKDTYIYYK